MCHLMIVLVGKSMWSATGVAKEIGFANDQDVPFFGVYVDGAGTSSGLPTGLARNRPSLGIGTRSRIPLTR